MTPETLLAHHDDARLWRDVDQAAPFTDVAAAYQLQLQVRRLRQARGEMPRGFKIGFTNRTIWPRYQVFAPIWGTVWNTTLVFAQAAGTLSLASTCQPRIEPEIVFGLRATPPAQASLQQLWEAIDWVAPGFEVVQSHLPQWKFNAAQTVADGALHARLLVGRQVPVRALGAGADELDRMLAAGSVELAHDTVVVDRGVGANVLDSPLRALHHFLGELRRCPGAPDLQAGDVVTTGTWTDAWPVSPGEHWSARFGAPLPSLDVRFT